MVVSFRHRELVGQHARILVHIDDGPFRDGPDIHRMRDLPFFRLVHEDIGRTFLPHRHLDDALARLVVGIGSHRDEQHVFIDGGRAPVRRGGHFPFLAGGHIDAVAQTGSRRQQGLFREIQVGQFRQRGPALADQAVGLGGLVFGDARGFLGGLERLDGQVVLLCGIVLDRLIVAHVERFLCIQGQGRDEDRQQDEKDSFHSFNVFLIFSNSESGLMESA